MNFKRKTPKWFRSNHRQFVKKREIILEYVRKNPNCTARDICDEFKYDITRVGEILLYLTRKDKLTRVRDSHLCRYVYKVNTHKELKSILANIGW